VIDDFVPTGLACQLIEGNSASNICRCNSQLSPYIVQYFIILMILLLVRYRSKLLDSERFKIAEIAFKLAADKDC